MIAYAESSAVLSWLLGEPREGEVRRLLQRAERVVASTLTEVECARALMHALATGAIEPTGELAGLQLLAQVSSTWVTFEPAGRVLARARTRFPQEPVRTLDALHLATALTFQEAHRAVTVVSLDERIRGNAVALGLAVGP